MTKTGKVSPQCFDLAAVQARLNVYSVSFSQQLTSERFTLDGFRSGAAVSLALAGVSLHDIMDHVGWKSSKTALPYIKLKQVVNPAGAAAKLADLHSDMAYKCLDSVKGFSQAFLAD